MTSAGNKMTLIRDSSQDIAIRDFEVQDMYRAVLDVRILSVMQKPSEFSKVLYGVHASSGLTSAGSARGRMGRDWKFDIIGT